jgi:hypothetical protein
MLLSNQSGSARPGRASGEVAILSNAGKEAVFSMQPFSRLAIVLVSASGFAAAQTAPRNTAPLNSVSFTKDIAPILQRSCQSCHNEAGIAPMSLMTYEEVRPWVRAIKAKVLAREMPPWFVEKNIGIQRFRDDPSLSREELAKISAWADDGAPRGDPAIPSASGSGALSSRWTIGTPDLVVSSPVVNIQPVAADFMKDIGPTPTGLTEDRYIQAMEVKEVSRNQKDTAAGVEGTGLNYFLVHHATISVAANEEQLDLNAEPSPEGNGASRILMYQMGMNAVVYSDNIGTLLPGGSALKFAIHVHSVGKTLPLRLDVAFKFYPKGYKPKYSLSGFTAGPRFQHEELDIPAGESNVRVDGYTPITRPMKMVTFAPHLHSNGKRMCMEAIYPDGRTETLNCAGWNHNWEKLYFYDDDAAPLLPKGTVIHSIAWFDNSAANPRDVEPRNWKGYGNRTVDDMAFFLPEVIYLTDEQYQQEVAARAAAKTTKPRGTQ